MVVTSKVNKECTWLKVRQPNGYAILYTETISRYVIKSWSGYILYPQSNEFWVTDDEVDKVVWQVKEKMAETLAEM